MSVKLNIIESEIIKYIVNINTYESSMANVQKTLFNNSHALPLK